MISDDGATIKIIDLGFVGIITSNNLRKDSELGTPSWMAPQIIS